MTKKTKTILAVALVGGVGYYMWMKSKKSPERDPLDVFRGKSFANAVGKGKAGTPCQFIEGGELMSGRISSYGKNVCQSSASITSRGAAL